MIDRSLVNTHVEPERDPRLARAIRDAEGPAPSAARLEMLRARIAAAAGAVFEMRRERAWWEWMARWARAEMGLAAAALMLAAVIGTATTVARGELGVDTMLATGSTRQSAVTPLDSVVTRAFAAGASSEQVMNAVVGPATGEWLLTAAVVR